MRHRLVEERGVEVKEPVFGNAEELIFNLHIILLVIAFNSKVTLAHLKDHKFEKVGIIALQHANTIERRGVQIHLNKIKFA